MVANEPNGIQGLLQYCMKHGVVLHKAIKPKQMMETGLGVYAIRKVKDNEQIVQVPIKQVFTVNNIPETCLPTVVRKNLAVHAQLAVFFAFGSETELQPYAPWLATWPKIFDFSETMPLLWGDWADHILQQLGEGSSVIGSNGTTGKHTAKRRRTSGTKGRCVTENQAESSASAPIGISAVLDGNIHPFPSPTLSTIPSNSLLSKMCTKLISHIRSVAHTLPHLKILDLQKPGNLVKFLHAWFQVNTRCFYYILPSPGKSRPRSKPPSDPNEAMALCPYMDLFNHTAPLPDPESSNPFPATRHTRILPCKVRSSQSAFTITTACQIPPDREIVLNYGAHTNDTLWSEYGFILPGSTNTNDNIPLDDIILAAPSLNAAAKTALEEHNYLGNYVLHNDGSVCYRTEQVGWLLVLGRQKWSKVISEAKDPADECTSPFGHGQFLDFVTTVLNKVQESTKKNKKMLEKFSVEDLLEHFSTMRIVREVYPESDEMRIYLARRRRDMCLIRWEQIEKMAERGLERLKEQGDE